MLLIRLEALLEEVARRAGSNFTGVGVIIASDPSQLPIAPLRPEFRIPSGWEPVEALTAMSLPTNELHDGFHILSPDFQVTHVSQYFAPPVDRSALLPTGRQPGARYMAALLGSKLPGVLATGVATHGQGVAIFSAGKEL